ncbi:MAG: helix-turn-helix transcriptional regulator [Clostridium botulinum]|nr:helix-turn-helix transcriptional regulator [Clostridium botulinum]
MTISYNKLWKQLIDKNMNKTDLRQAAGIGTSTLAKFSKNAPVSMEVILRICKVLECDIGDVMEIVQDKE